MTNEDPKIPPVPAGTKASGRRLWRDILAVYDLGPHERYLLTEAVQVADTVTRLQEAVRESDLTTTNRHGEIVSRPEIVECRLQRQVLAKLLAALRLPDADSDNRPQRRGGFRGRPSGHGTHGRPYGVAS